MKKRTTYRQKVIAIYPEAELYNGYDISFRKSDEQRDTRYRVWLSIDKHSPKEAWKDAWQNIQLHMLEKFSQ